MADQIYIGNVSQGLTTNPLAFNIDNDAFPKLYNFYSWRGRIKRKRGTFYLGQLEIQAISVASPTLSWQLGPIGTLDGSGNFSGNLITVFSFPAGITFVPESFNLSDGVNTYTEPTPANGSLVGVVAGTGTINYATGDLTITGGNPGGTLVGNFSYYPQLPVMGLRDFADASSTTNFPLLLAFDKKNAYQLNQTPSEINFYNVTYYKATNTPFTWSGQDYNQFWTTNYSGCIWATNNVPGMQYEPIASIVSGTVTTITTTLPMHDLITGDWVWFNEITDSDFTALNGNAYQITVTSSTAFTIAVTTSGSTDMNDGIFQTLTATSPNVNSTGDGIKWYDHDPTAATGLPTTKNFGWVNFAPPLSSGDESISNLPAGQYYLVGALAMQPFKDRLVFFKPWVKTSGSDTPIQLNSTIIWSWNGTPFYSLPLPNTITSPTVSRQTSDPTAYYVDMTGKGGFLSEGSSQSIVTISNNEDVILVGFTNHQTRLVYTSNDLYPFLFYTINRELGSSATFSAITLDRGALSIGTRGFIITSQTSCERFDLQIPDQVFTISANNNSLMRINSVRDFFKEWCYFSYTPNSSSYTYPTQTFMYNYRDNTWAIFYENFTAHGNYYKSLNYTWATLPYATWTEWVEPWGSATLDALFPSIVGGTPQGYVLIKAQGTGEALSCTINNITASGLLTQITSTNHCVADNDYIQFQNILGMTALNGQIAKVVQIIDNNNFIVSSLFPAGTYLGLGQFSKLSRPSMQTKQFNFYWQQGRKVRLSAQRYLMDTTSSAQVTVNLYLSQNPDQSWNDPINNSPPNSLVYSQIMYTCPESTNIGLTPANTNLQMPNAAEQYQIWHRFNTSLIGDSVQIGITLSDDQMMSYEYATAEITLHGIHLTVQPSSVLA